MKNSITFESFVQNSYLGQKSFTILTSYSDSRNKRMLKLSMNLITWSFFGVTLDVICGFVAASLVVTYGANFITAFGPTGLFFVINLIVKAIYINWFMKGNIPMKLIILGVIPYLGSGIISGFVLKNHPEYREALLKYTQYINKHRSLKDKLRMMLKVIQDNKKTVLLLLIAIILGICTQLLF
ncbi:MAG: hypothetical protein MRY57_02765 [Candidatus Pacebacteria bacterium]|nr:hypothetical protein [Candidatus Paceibacterota bacterium]